MLRTPLRRCSTSSDGMIALPRVQPVEPVAGIPHGGFYEGGRAQEANSCKARPYPPLVHQSRLLPRGSGGGNFHVEAVVGRILKCEVHPEPVSAANFAQRQRVGFRSMTG